MRPAPTSTHQRLCGILFTEISIFLKQQRCEPFIAPFDVYLPEYPDQNFNSIDSIVQPDISVICDLDKTIEKGCLGAPDLMIEILSKCQSPEQNLSRNFSHNTAFYAPKRHLFSFFLCVFVFSADGADGSALCRIFGKFTPMRKL